MKAAVIEHQGGVENLVYRDWPDPEPGADEVLMRVSSCALNYLDLEVRRGMPGLKVPMPFISGGDMAGIVEAVGEVAAGRIEAVIDSTHPLRDIRAAQTRLESRAAFGKVILHP